MARASSSTNPDSYFLPRLLKFARTRAGLSQRQLADKCDLGQPCVVGWESGVRATSEQTLEKVARGLGYGGVEAFLLAELKAWELTPQQRRTA